IYFSFFFFFQAEDGIRDFHVTGVQTCALPISPCARKRCNSSNAATMLATSVNWIWLARALSSNPHAPRRSATNAAARPPNMHWRSEEHTSELQSRENLVCRLLLEKKKTTNSTH